METRKCHQTDCEAVATYRYTWPGKNEEFICEPHGKWAVQVAGAIGMELEMILLVQEGTDAMLAAREEQTQ